MRTATYLIDPHSGLVEGVRQVPSPNFNERPAGTTIDTLVIHGISLPPGQFGGQAVEQLFTNCLDCRAHPAFAELEGVKVSAHLFVRRDGEVVQFVPLTRRAWHAGQSQFDGRENCNDFSIGIELEGCDTVGYEPVQYQRLVALTRAIQQCFPAITPERIVGHCHIAPDRKTDPGPAFAWEYYRRLLAEEATER